MKQHVATWNPLHLERISNTAIASGQGRLPLGHWIQSLYQELVLVEGWYPLPEPHFAVPSLALSAVLSSVLSLLQ